MNLRICLKECGISKSCRDRVAAGSCEHAGGQVNPSAEPCAVCMSLLHDRAHVGVSELSPHDVAPGRHHAATGHHLDDVHFALDAFPYGCRDLTAARNLTPR